jgi:hypothetical protein
MFFWQVEFIIHALPYPIGKSSGGNVNSERYKSTVFIGGKMVKEKGVK